MARVHAVYIRSGIGGSMSWTRSVYFLYGQRVMWISAIYATIDGSNVLLQKARGGAALASCKRRVEKSRGEIS